jgi:hypothetical protein
MFKCFLKLGGKTGWKVVVQVGGCDVQLKTCEV